MLQQVKYDTPIRVGISTCLLGEKVRFDGGHKQDRFLTNILGDYFTWVPICPEVELGLGTPRESIRLVQNGEDIRFVTLKSGTDYTDGMRKYAATRTEALAEENLSGYILKRASPSCGMERVRIHHPSDMPSRNGRGLFADALMKRLPQLPVEEEGHLNEPRLRENFITRVFAYHKWRQIETAGITPITLERFHQTHKFVLMAHNQLGTRRLGAIVAEFHRSVNSHQQRTAYINKFTDVMRRPPTIKGHANVLHHMLERFCKQLALHEYKEATDMIRQYEAGRLPLIVLITLIRHYVRKFAVECLHDEVYLNPHPDELMLLNQL